MPSFLSPLTPPILVSERSCSKNLEIIGGPLVFFYLQTDRHRITLFNLLTANYWPLRQQSNIFIISAKVIFSNLGLTTNPLLPPFLAVQPPSHPQNNAILRHLRIYVQLLYLPGLKNVVADFLSRPPSQATGSVAATTAADPVDYEEMAAEQHRCPETQQLLVGTSLNWLPCRQALNTWLEMFSPVHSGP
jgi:hypothetical protein